MMKFFNNLKLHSKLTISHIILIAIPTIVMSFFFMNNIYDMIVSDTIRQEQALAGQTSLTLDSTLAQVKKVSTSIMENSYLNNLLNARDPRTIKNLSENTEEKYKLKRSFQSLIDQDLITDIKIYTDGIDSSFYEDSNTGNYFLPVSKSNGTYWNGIFSGTNKKQLYCPSFYLSAYEIKHYGSLSYIQKIVTDTNQVSYIVVYFSKEKLDSMLQQNISINNSVTYVINERNSMVSASDYSLAGAYLMKYDTIVNTAASSTNFITKTVLSEEVYTGCYNIAGTDWYMVSILPAKPILEKGTSIINNFILLYLFLLLCAFILASILSHSITKRVNHVCQQMRSVRLGPPIRMQEPLVHDEIGDLVDNYNYMTDEMNHLLEEQAHNAETLRIAEFRALQAQINPHFLYNTMDMINWLAKSGKNEEVSEAVQALSKFYKLTLSKKDVVSSIAQELEHVTLYVQLQNMRYQDKINFVVDIPDELLEYEIPKLTFQPVVENAIYHGLLEKESQEGTIVLTGWLEGDSIYFMISDDGIGMENDKLNHILTGEGPSQKGSNIGVYNTHLRLHMLYGEAYGLSYTSTYGKGTDVQISIKANLFSKATPSTLS